MVANSEIIAEVIDTYERAGRANEQTANRVGNIVRIDAESADDVMVTTDMHGARVQFERLLAIADLGSNTRRHLIMQEVCHGGPTYPASNACMSHLMLEDVAKLKCEFPDRFHFILSNHELAEIMEYPITKKGRMLNLVFRFGMQLLYGDDADRVRGAMCDFLRTCPLGVRVGSDVVITHSAPAQISQLGFDSTLFDRPLESNDWRPKSSLFRMVWGRDFSEGNGEAFATLMDAKILIHGHESCPDGYQVPNSHQVIIDSCGPRGCYVILPAGGDCSQSQIVERICYLNDDEELT